MMIKCYRYYWTIKYNFAYSGLGAHQNWFATIFIKILTNLNSCYTWDQAELHGKLCQFGNLSSQLIQELAQL